MFGVSRESQHLLPFLVMGQSLETIISIYVAKWAKVPPLSPESILCLLQYMKNKDTLLLPNQFAIRLC